MSLYQKTRHIWLSMTKNRSDFAKNFIKAATGSFGIKVSSISLAFVTSLILARLLQTKDFGIYTYALAWANLLSIPATLGFDKLLIREASVYKARAEWTLMRGILGWTNSIVLIASTGLAILAGIAAWIIYGSSNPLTMWAILVGLFALPINSLRNVRLGAMQGLSKVVLAMVPELLVSPIMILGALSGWQLLYDNQERVLWILGVRIMAIAVSFALGARWLYQSIPAQVKQASAQYNARTWLTSSLPFMFLGVTEIINSQGDILMLGVMKDVSVVGIYGVVSRISILVIFIQAAVNNVLGPIIASFYADNKLADLHKIIVKSARIVLLISLVVSSILFLFGRSILSSFGSDFVIGYSALLILTIGQLFNSALGPVGLLLNMTGYEKLTAISIFSSAIINIILNLLLIPKLGINGAAIATASSITAVNFFNMFLVSQKLKMTPFILDIIKLKSAK